MIGGSIVTKWAALAIKVLLTDNKSVSKAGYSAMDGIWVSAALTCYRLDRSVYH
jgi:hypothetical protein